MPRKKLKAQRGSISLLGIATIGLALLMFNEVMDYGNSKLLDRKLDNYAKTVAYVALRTELALTEGMSAAEKEEARAEVEQLLNQVGLYSDPDSTGYNLDKKVTFGNFDDNGNFVPLSSNASTPKDVSAGDQPPEFSAVAVQLWSDENSFFGYVPQGKALYGLSSHDQGATSDCYCKNRYYACLESDLTLSDLSALPATEAEQVIVKNSVARQNYCRYGFSDSNVSDSTASKYPYASFNEVWIGRPPEDNNWWSFYSTGTDEEALAKVLNHQPLYVPDGEDPLNTSSSMCFCMPSTSITIYGETQSQSVLEKGDIAVGQRGDYRCKPSSSVYDCDNESTSWFGSKIVPDSSDVLFSDSVYIGYEGTCVPQTNSSNLAMSRCLSYNDGGTTRFQSCLDIERSSALEMNFFERMLAFFFGPFLNWERAYETLDCEMQKMRYRGWMFWGGWETV